MGVKIKIEAESLDELQKLFTFLGGIGHVQTHTDTTEGSTETAEVPAPKRSRRTKAEIAAEAETAAAKPEALKDIGHITEEKPAKAETTPALVETAAAQPDALTKLKEATLALVRGKSKAVAMEVLKKYGAADIPSVKPADYEKVTAEMEAALKAA